jgi:hypothetical protein
MKNSCTGDRRYRAQVVEFGRHAWLRAMWEKSCAGSSPALGKTEEPHARGFLDFYLITSKKCIYGVCGRID